MQFNGHGVMGSFCDRIADEEPDDLDTSAVDRDPISLTRAVGSCVVFVLFCWALAPHGLKLVGDIRHAAQQRAALALGGAIATGVPAITKIAAQAPPTFLGTFDWKPDAEWSEKLILWAHDPGKVIMRTKGVGPKLLVDGNEMTLSCLCRPVNISPELRRVIENGDLYGIRSLWDGEGDQGDAR